MFKGKGVYTAIITPFKSDESIDWDAFKKLVEFQIENKVAGIVPVGTTGESPTIEEKEHEEIIKKVVGWVKGRCEVIAGTGSNSTKHAIHLSKMAEKCGADACLVVNPYYNKPTQEGLYRHFKAVADSVKIPIVLYNIKGRTGVNVETPTLMRIAKDCKNVIAVKEASGDLNQMKDVISKRQKGFSVLSGDDNMTLDLIKAGGDGIISVASNAIPGKMVSLVDSALKGDYKTAEKLNAEMQDFFKYEFVETNPIPIKAAISMMGICKEVYRLPMCELRPENKEKWHQVLKQMKIVS